MKKSAIALLLTGLIALTACGTSGNTASSAAASYRAKSADSYMATEAYNEGFYDYEASSAMAEAKASGGTSAAPKVEEKQDSARKRIVTYNLTAETDDFDGLLAALEARIEAFGGYLESIDTYNGSKYDGYRSTRYSNLTIRIPAKKADEFVNFIGESTNVTNKSLSSDDVTLQYVDLESRKKSYEAEMESLLALLEKAERIEDIITIQERITNVRYQLESMESQLRTYDNLVDYTAIYLYVKEVKEYTEPEPETYLDRLGDAFVGGWRAFVEWCQDASIAIVASLPAWILLAVIVVVIIVIIKKKGKKKVKPITPATPVSNTVNEETDGTKQ